MQRDDTETRRHGDAEKKAEDQRYYLPCLLRKNQARVAVTVCMSCRWSKPGENGKPVECDIHVQEYRKRNHR